MSNYTLQQACKTQQHHTPHRQNGNNKLNKILQTSYKNTNKTEKQYQRSYKEQQTPTICKKNDTGNHNHLEKQLQKTISTYKKTNKTTKQLRHNNNKLENTAGNCKPTKNKLQTNANIHYKAQSKQQAMQNNYKRTTKPLPTHMKQNTNKIGNTVQTHVKTSQKHIENTEGNNKL